MKNKVTESAFLEWYFSDSNDLYWLGKRVVNSLRHDGVFNVDARTFFDECEYIPQYICEDDDGDEEYEPKHVELIKG